MNQTIKCLIVDDEPLAIEVIKEYIERVPQLELVRTCPDAMEALQAVNNFTVDLLFLDIEMPEMNGIDFLKSLSNPPQVILTTAFRKYAFDSYDVDVVDYLLKPISFNRFFKSISKYIKLNSSITQQRGVEKPQPAKSSSIYVYADKKNVKVHLEDIIYVESIKDYVRIHTEDKNLISKATITKYENLLPETFLRIHRSFIVNTTKITAYTQHDIEINTKEIPIGSSYKKRVSEYMKQ